MDFWGQIPTEGGAHYSQDPRQWVGAQGEQCENVLIEGSAAVTWKRSSQAGAESEAGSRETGAGNVHIYIDNGRKWL